MSTFEVTIEKITIHPHPNADRLEYAQVGLYNAVVAKGIYSTGDEVFYIPEFAVLPERLIKELNLEGKLKGKNKDRVVPVRLRGLVSQGLVAPLSILEGTLDREVKDHSEALQIAKWEPEIPSALSGDVSSASDLVRWIDIENIKKFPDMFTDGELVTVQEKVHGTATCVTVIDPLSETPETIVTSKGLSSKYLGLKPSEKNVYWKMFHKYNLLGFTKFVAQKTGATKVAVFGETYGSLQDLHYGLTNQLGYILFDVHVTHSDQTKEWVNSETVTAWAEEFGLPQAPLLYTGPYSLEKITELSYGPEQVSGKETNIREGVVVRPAVEGRYEGSRKIGKFVSDDYLTRSGGTEYN